MFTSAFPILVVADLNRSLGFYRDLLGFTETYRFPPDGEPGYVALDLDGSHLGLGQAPPDEPAPTAPAFAYWVYADDVDAAVAMLREHGVTVLQEPADQPWGERLARVADPDGYRIDIGSRASDADGG